MLRGRHQSALDHPHVVASDEPVAAIEDSVLEALGHRRSGELLKTHDQLTFEVAAHAQEQQVMQEITERGVKFRAPAFGPLHCLGDISNIVISDVTGLGLHISAVDRETGNDLAQRLVQLIMHVVAVPPVAFTDLDE
jgi:hypothetical protein